MRLAVISPHLDDAVFSLGEHLFVWEGATIVSPFGGIPEDDYGKKKYTILSEEHNVVCDKMGLEYISGTYFDDVYASARDLRGMTEWFFNTLTLMQATDVWIPLGIHHPDHKVAQACALSAVQQLHLRRCFYEELPYRVLYPEKVNRTLLAGHELVGYAPALAWKKEMCGVYESQMHGDDIERCLYAPERLWAPKHKEEFVKWSP